MVLVYVDTNIFMDFLLARDKKAYNFFMQTISCKHNIIISDLVLKELEYQQLSSEAAVMIQTLQDKIEIEYANRQDKQRATQINTYYNDALHAAIALRRSVPLLTKNVKDFAHIPNLHVMRIDAF